MSIKILIDKIEKQILKILEYKSSCSVMLTGGRSVAALYGQWAKSLVNYEENIFFYFGDERCVHPTSDESNFFLARNSLFVGHNNRLLDRVYRIRGENKNLEHECFRYSLVLPDTVDILLLSMGEDGHVASLFPNSPALCETKRSVMPVLAPKAPWRRLTVTPPVILAAKHVFVLAVGPEKRLKYEEALLDPEDTRSIPARLVLNRTWIFDLNEDEDDD